MADAPIDQLLPRVADLAKGWLLALLEQAPLDDAPTILTGGLVQHGPGICDAILRALADDRDLTRVTVGGALEGLVSRVGELAGATGAEATSCAVDALHAVIWSALRDELPRPDPDQISELAERLGLVIGLVRGAALRRCSGTPPAGVPSVGDAPWVPVLENEISRAERLDAPLSLLLAELDEVDRIVAVEQPGEAATSFGRFADALRSVVRRRDILACETEGRAWIIAPDTDRAGAVALGARIASAVRAAEPWRGAPMTASIGIAMIGEDGRDSSSLIEAAEVSKLAALARGIAVARADGAEGTEAGEATNTGNAAKAAAEREAAEPSPGEPPRGPGPTLVG